MLISAGSSASLHDPPRIHTAPPEQKMPTEPGGNSNPHTDSQNYRNSRHSKLTGAH